MSTTTTTTTANAFGKTICSICYEDLKPLIEDLQSISICGHVFHELCLQQWLEYCPKGKKCTCPVCKQKCSVENICRLYFQSVGDASDVNLTQKAAEGVFGEGEDKDPVFLAREVNKLKGRLSAISTAFESQGNNLNEVNKELCICKEEVKREITLKNDALQQKASFKESLLSKSQELVKTSAECTRLQERNMALAKELAALKLVSDLNLEEDEVLKLASFGNGTNSRDTVDVLRKSLVLRNKSYKELMAQCNLLGRGESRSVKKLEKAKEKMKKLKTRVRELELALEERENEDLRSLRASSRTSGKVVDPIGVKSNSPYITKFPSLNQTERSAEPMTVSNQIDGLTSHSILFRKAGNLDFHKELGLNTCNKKKDVVDIDLEKDSDLFMDDTIFDHPVNVHEHPSTLKTQTNNHFGDDVTLKGSGMSMRSVDIPNKEKMLNSQSDFSGLSASKVGTKNNNTIIDVTEDEVVHIDNPSSPAAESSADEVAEVLPFHNRKEVLSPMPILHPGDQCFSGGLLGPDGVNRHLGKWCKRSQGSSTGVGDLIAVGADGRGGKVKVLRTQNHSDVKVSSVLSKKGKSGSKQSGHQLQGNMQIEHFFGKANRS